MTRPRRWNTEWLSLVCLCGLIGCSIISPPAGPPPIATLEEAEAALLSSDEDTRLDAVRFLGDSRSPDAIPLLVGRLEDSSVLVRTETTLALSNINDPRTIEPLRRALADPEEPVRFSAASALYELGDYSGEKVLIEGLSSQYEDFRFQALWFLGRMRSRPAIGGIIALLQDPQPRTRSTAAYVLGLFRDKSAGEALLRALNDPEPYVRKDSWEALKEISGRDLPFTWGGDPLLRRQEIRLWEQWWEDEEKP
jgi:HEAT repeat protein